MNWRLSHRAERAACLIADRHYSRQKIGTPQFVPPGRCLVLMGRTGRALWTTSWPFAEFVKHSWAGAWTCSMFRNEGEGIASELIIEAVAVTRWKWEVPELGMVTFIDRDKVKPTMVRGKPVWGWTYRKAGFVECGETKGGLLALQLTSERMPEPQEPFIQTPALQFEATT